MLKPGNIINGKYRILRLIGDGGMGSVYEAEHEVLGSRVALKFLHPEIAKQHGLKERFLQEARVSATVQSVHICRVVDVDTSEDGAYLVMELLQGEPLQAVLDREQRIDAGRAVDFSLQILEGLQIAHQQGVVHRDLKPDNVFLVPTTSGPQVKLLDFGIAKLRHSEEYKMTLTRPGAVMGTPEYMAPEQAFSADLVDQRSDIYSVGVMLYEMLSGQRPADGSNPQQIAEQIITGKVPRLDSLCTGLPPGLVEAVQRAIEGNPDDRWPSCIEMMQALFPYAPPQVGRGSHPGGSRNQTGAATPFVPVSKTPVIEGGSVSLPSASDAPLAQSSSPGPVPKTVPPDDQAPPPVSQLGASPLGPQTPGSQTPGSQTPGFQNSGPAKTDSMPAFSGPGNFAPVPPSPTIGAPGPGYAPVAAGAYAPQPTNAQVSSAPRKRKSRAGWWVSLTLLLLGGAAAGGWAYYDYYLAPSPRPPPPPTLRTDLEADSPEFRPPEVDDDFPTNGRTTERRTPVKPGPGTPGGVKDPLPIPSELPTIPIPTSLPPGLPTAFPTALPTSFPFPLAPTSEPPPAAP